MSHISPAKLQSQCYQLWQNDRSINFQYGCAKILSKPCLLQRIENFFFLFFFFYAPSGIDKRRHSFNPFLTDLFYTLESVIYSELHLFIIVVILIEKKSNWVSLSNNSTQFWQSVTPKAVVRQELFSSYDYLNLHMLHT